jgi:cholesterol oxidase
MKSLTESISRMANEYDVVVVGSGYGGAIPASRLSRAGKSVCVLERGREILPGQYPETLFRALREVQARFGDRSIGSPTALFDIHKGDDINVLVGCGLGGTSLINANVALWPDNSIFNIRWPKVLRGGQNPELTSGRDRAEEMLGSQPYPGNWPSLDKVTAFRASAAAMASRVDDTPINVTFTDGINAAGVFQPKCTLCGNCCSGCNVGAKNTVLMNYLPDAKKHGASIFTETEVRTVTKTADGKWRVDFTYRGARRRSARTRSVVGNSVVLAAGTLGTAGILLRSRRAGLPTSDQLGCHFSGNGDALAFAYNANPCVNAMGWRHGVTGGDVGPCITTMINRRDREVVLQEGVIPGAMRFLLPFPMAWNAALLRVGDELKTPLDSQSRRGRIAASARALTRLTRYGMFEALSRTQTYLVMGSDDDEGTIVLEGDSVKIDWKGAGERPVFLKDNDLVIDAAQGIDATHLRDPLWTRAFHKSLMTVHPIGGCVMADDSAHGVVNDRGQVFCGGGGSTVHEGLYVSDGSIVPRPLGVNPSLTISALAERISHYI